jgi:hypothetical protein
MLPPGILTQVFDQLDLPSRFTARKVCREWRASAATGCAHLRLTAGSSSMTIGGHEQTSTWAGQVRLRGHRTRLALADEADAADGAGEVKFDRGRWLNRTRGHLPQPLVIDDDMEMVDAAPIALARTRRGVALLVDRSVTSLRNQLESGDDNDTDTASDTDAAESDDDDRSAALTTTQEESMAEGDARSQSENYDDASQKQYRKEAAAAGRKATVLQALDLSTSMYQPYERIHAGSNGPIHDSFRDTKPKSLQRVLCEVNLGGLCWLQSLSVRGCGSLELLVVPPSLTALDASGASRLRILSDGHSDGWLPEQASGCRVLNLNGCRELRRVGLLSRPRSLVHCRELDLSSCGRLPVSTVSEALRQAGSLASISLRYVARDPMLCALAASPAATGAAQQTVAGGGGGTLRLLDCAFSAEMTDAGVVALVASARRLQRVNLRGCRSISTACYNQTPVTLVERNRAAESNAAASAGGGGGGGGDSSYSHGGGAVGGGASSGVGADASLLSPASKLCKGDNIFFFTQAQR